MLATRRKSLASARDKAEILQRLGALRPDTTRRWGRMSPHQMVCHLSDGYRMATDERPTRLVATPLPRSIMKWIALYVMVPWPRDLRTTPELDQDAGGTRPIDFERDRAGLVQLLDGITTHQRGRLAGTVHPYFGAMSEAVWLRWAYVHADHHLRQFGL